MPRPLSRAQTLQNQAFVRALRRTGNLRLAAREAGIAYGTIQHRRKHHPALAQACDAALAFAQARFAEAGTQVPAARARPAANATATAAPAEQPPRDPRRTAGGEPVVVRSNDGRLQMRRAQPGKLTKQCEQAFLAALSATANVRLAAAAAGASPAAFYRRRCKNPGFACEYRLALEMGYERIEMALLESANPASHADDAWRHNDPPPIPAMTAAQALHLLCLHQKEARLQAEPPHLKRRRGETSNVHSFRLAAMYEAKRQRMREDFEVAEAARRERGEPATFGPRDLPELPALDQVTGWSRADPTRKRHGDAALFGGWRLEDLKKR